MRKFMSAILISARREHELRLKMDQRTVVEQECEIRYLRRRLEKLAEKAATSLQPAPLMPVRAAA
jgi:NADH:ubiquinone oxidoreductase subunit D